MVTGPIQSLVRSIALKNQGVYLSISIEFLLNILVNIFTIGEAMSVPGFCSFLVFFFYEMRMKVVIKFVERKRKSLIVGRKTSRLITRNFNIEEG